MRVLARSGLQRGHHDILHLVRQDRRRPTRPRLIVQAVQAAGDEPGPPHVYGRLIYPRSAAASLFDPPSAQRSTIFARSARYWAVSAPGPPGLLSPLCLIQHQFRLPPSDRRSVLEPGQPLVGELARHLDTDLTATPAPAHLRHSTSPRHTPR